jgi:YVTN family beta-propeller protein
MRGHCRFSTACALLLWVAGSCGKSTGPGNTLDVSPDSIVLVRSDSVQLSVSVLDHDGNLVSGVAVSFTSSDTSIVTVTNLGRVHSKTVLGATTVRIRGGGAIRDISVHVIATPAFVAVAPADTTIFQYDSVRFKAAVFDANADTIPGLTVTWQSTDSTVAIVGGTGVAHSFGHAGAAQIQARYGALLGTAHLTVRDTTILGNRVVLAGQPYGAAISATGVAYVTLGSASQLARTNLPSQAFAPAVAVGSVPSEVAFTSTGAIAYVTNQGSGNVGIVDVASNTQVDVITVNGNPFEVIVQPGDSIIYVSTNANRVYGIRVATKALVDSFPTPAIGNGMLIKDTLLYVSTHSGGTVIEFNLKTRTVARTFTVGGTPQKMAISTDGNTLYIANEAGYVQFWNRITGLQIGSPTLLTGSAGYGIALRPTTGKLYVTTAYFGGGGIYVIDPTTHAIITNVIAGGSTRRVVFAANGVGFVPNESGWVDFIK